MLKIEKKLLQWVEKHMFLLMALLAMAIALFLKRMAIWWGTPEVSYYFDGHKNNIQSALYLGLVRLVQYLPMIPLHSIKWLAVLADFGVAVLCLLAVGGHTERLKLKPTFYFSVCLLSPMVYLRGVSWGQIDSVAFLFLLAAYLLWERNKKIIAVLLAVIAVSLYPCLLPIACFWVLYQNKGIPGKDWIYMGIMIVASVVLQGVCSMALGNGFADGVMSCVRWTTYDPYTGIVFNQPLLWVKQMINLFGYAGVMISGIAAYRHKISYVTTLLINLAVLLVYASFMFPIV